MSIETIVEKHAKDIFGDELENLTDAEQLTIIQTLSLFVTKTGDLAKAKENNDIEEINYLEHYIEKLNNVILNYKAYKKILNGEALVEFVGYVTGNILAETLKQALKALMR